jgi:hypothetical protein
LYFCIFICCFTHCITFFTSVMDIPIFPSFSYSLFKSTPLLTSDLESAYIYFHYFDLFLTKGP